MRDMRHDLATGLVKFGAIEATIKWLRDDMQKPAL
jgi:hypothetical protein